MKYQFFQLARQFSVKFDQMKKGALISALNAFISFKHDYESFQKSLFAKKSLVAIFLNCQAIMVTSKRLKWKLREKSF